MGYLLLFACLIGILLLSLHFDKYELFAPSSLGILGFCIASFLAFLGLSTWNTVPLGAESFFIVVVGCLSFLAGSALISKTAFASESRVNLYSDDGACREAFVPGLWKYIVVAGVLCLTIYLQISETYQIAAENGVASSDLSSMIKSVRDLTSTMYSSKGVAIGSGFSFLLRQLQKVATAVGYVSVYLFVKELRDGSSLKEKIRAALPSAFLLILASLHVLSMGGRRDIMYYCLAGLTMYFIMELNRGVPAKQLLFSISKMLIIIVPIGVIGFWAAGQLVGRSAKTGLIEYISFYFGCGVPTLQSLIDQGIDYSINFGQYTFYYVYTFLSKLGLPIEVGSSSIDWIRLGSHASNVPTSFASYYFDFGYIGVAVMPFVAGVLFNLVYRSARFFNYPTLIALIGFMSGYIFDMARANASSIGYFLSPSRMLTILLIMAATSFFTGSYACVFKWISRWKGLHGSSAKLDERL